MVAVRCHDGASDEPTRNRNAERHRQRDDLRPSIPIILHLDGSVDGLKNRFNHEHGYRFVIHFQWQITNMHPDSCSQSHDSDYK